MADDEDTSTTARSYPLPVALEGVTDGSEYEGKPATPERARALGAFVEELLQVDEGNPDALANAAQRHDLTSLTPEMVAAARELVVLLHEAATGDALAQGTLRSAVRGARHHKRSKAPEQMKRRADLVQLMVAVRSVVPSDDTEERLREEQEFRASLCGIDSAAYGSCSEAIAMLPELRKLQTPERAAARLSSRIGLFDDLGKGEDAVRKQFDSARKRAAPAAT